jgi:hypothetical protein
MVFKDGDRFYWKRGLLAARITKEWIVYSPLIIKDIGDMWHR